MPRTGTDDPKDATLSARVESRVKTAQVQHAHEKNGDDPYVNVKPATVSRDAVYLYYLVLWNELSEDVRADLDPERLADAIVTIPGDYVRRVASVDVRDAVEVSA